MGDVRYKVTVLYNLGLRGIEPRVFEDVYVDITGSLQTELVVRRETTGEGVTWSKPVFVLKQPRLVRMYAGILEFEGVTVEDISKELASRSFHNRLHLEVTGVKP